MTIYNPTLVSKVKLTKQSSDLGGVLLEFVAAIVGKNQEVADWGRRK